MIAAIPSEIDGNVCLEKRSRRTVFHAHITRFPTQNPNIQKDRFSVFKKNVSGGLCLECRGCRRELNALYGGHLQKSRENSDSILEIYVADFLKQQPEFWLDSSVSTECEIRLQPNFEIGQFGDATFARSLLDEHGYVGFGCCACAVLRDKNRIVFG